MITTTVLARTCEEGFSLATVTDSCEFSTITLHEIIEVDARPNRRVKVIQFVAILNWIVLDFPSNDLINLQKM